MDKSIKFIKKKFDINPDTIFEVPFNHEYESVSYDHEYIKYQSRLAKKTPKKKGYFLACWIKDKSNINIPYSADDFADYLIVIILDQYNKGYFKFPQSILLEKGILKSPRAKGKMAFRVYPSWESELNATALKTQAWQVPYFYTVS